MRISRKPDAPTDAKPAGGYPVIVRGTPEWDEWMEYFAHTGNPHAHPNSYARKVGRMTVRAQFPEAYDPAWRSRDPVGIPQGSAPPTGLARSSGRPLDPYEADRQRQAVQRMISALQSEMTRPVRNGARDGRDAVCERKQAQEWLAQYSAGEPAQVSVSPRLAEKLAEMAPHHREAAE